MSLKTDFEKSFFRALRDALISYFRRKEPYFRRFSAAKNESSYCSGPNTHQILNHLIPPASGHFHRPAAGRNGKLFSISSPILPLGTYATKKDRALKAGPASPPALPTLSLTGRARASRAAW
jgi:hypothetical protein